MRARVADMDQTSGAMAFAGDMPEGWTARLMPRQRGSPGAGGRGRRAARRVRGCRNHHVGRPACPDGLLHRALPVDGAAHRGRTKSPSRGTNSVRTSGASASIRIGEIAPAGGLGGAELHNQTMTIVGLAETESLKEVHRLLAHQLARATGKTARVDLPALLGTVDLAYAEADRDRHRTDRAALVMCQEMEQLNADLNNLRAPRCAHGPGQPRPVPRDHGAPTCPGTARRHVDRGFLHPISTASKASTTRWVTTPAISCSSRPPSGCACSVRDCDTLARIGGERVPAAANVCFTTRYPLRTWPGGWLRHSRSRSISTASRPASGCSIGIALSPQDGTQVDELIKNADIALYRAKIHWAREFCFFKFGMEAMLRRRREIEQDIALFLAAGAFDLAFQPLFGGEHHRHVVGFEALLRWPNPGRDPVRRTSSSRLRKKPA